MLLPLTTSRLLIRRFTAADAEPLLRYRSDPAVLRFQSSSLATPAGVQNLIADSAQREPLVAGTWFQLALSRRDSGALIGDLGLHPHADDPRLVELGITLDPAAQRQGFAVEALSAVLDHLFTQTATHRVSCSVDPANTSCLRLLERIGLRPEAHFVESLWINGAWVDDIVFGLLHREWPTTQPTAQPTLTL